MLVGKKKCLGTKESRCHLIDKRINFSPLSQRGLLFPFLIIFLNALQVAVLHVDGDAVEFNELWAKAERLSCKINEWQPLAGEGWHLHSSRAHPDAGIGGVPRAAQPSRAAHGRLVNEVPGFPAIVLVILSASRWPLVEEEANHLCFWALEKVSPSPCQRPWASRDHRWLISLQNLLPEDANGHSAGLGFLVNSDEFSCWD